MTALDRIREAAQTYVERGWKVFALSTKKSPLANCDPCRAEHRTPVQMEACECLTCHGFYAATDDVDRVEAMFSGHPGRLLAIRTGAASGLAVVDVDPPEGLGTMRQLMAEGLLPETCAQRTGSGGWHLLYRHPGGYLMSGAGKIGPKVDSKADGGYIVAAPSTHPRTGEPYTWRWDWPTAPIDDLHPTLAARLRPPAPRPRLDTGGRFTEVSSARLRGLAAAVLNAEEGNGNNTLYWASCKAGEMVRAGEISEAVAYDVLFTAAAQLGIPERDAGRDPRHGTIGSGLRRGQR
ncbi:bifunctional DNA primase/polymerase [Nocardiopsis sp. CNT-189]|uniref:bifunctional DNA primase/polymerase n=1 Tax=Nocardiopsis oceanisediminis TaxID=2816862 RepID=UPI003B3500F5